MANHPPHFRADWLLPGQLWRRHVELHHPRLPHPLHHHPLPAARRRAQPGTRRPPGLRHRAAADPTAGKGGGGGAAGRRQNRHPIPGPDVASWRRLSAAAALPAPALGRCVQQGIHNLPIFYLGPGGGFALHSENFTYFYWNVWWSVPPILIGLTLHFLGFEPGTYCTLFFPPIYINCSLGVEVWKQEVVGYPEAVAGDGLDLLPGPSALYPTGQQGIPALETSQGLWKHVSII